MAGAAGGLLFGYDIGAISSATQELRAQFALSPSGLGIAVSVALVGTIVGALAAGLMADAIDRRHSMLASGFLYMLASLGAASASSFERFSIFRFICGISIGVISVMAPMYLAEISPPLLRGRIVGAFQLNVGVGVVLAFALSYLISLHFPAHDVWRFTLACGAVPAVLYQALLFRASQSPRRLALKRRFTDMRTALVALGSADPDGDQADLMAALDEFGGYRQSSLFSRRYLRPIFLAASIAIFNQLTGVNVLLYYVLDVFTVLGSGQLNGHKDTVIVAATSLVATMIALNIIDKFGRKPLLLVGAVGMGACLLLLPTIRYMHWPALSVVIVLVCYNSFFAFSQGTVIWVYLSEIFPLPVRGSGQTMGSVVHWVANALITGTFPVIVSGLGSKVFVVLAAIMALQFFVILFLYPETKSLGLEAVASAISK
jgi:SP family arabinose:H+ symporter-like MFS transporter